MAFLTANEAGYIVKDYKYQRYPLNMHRGHADGIQSLRVNSEQEEQAAAAQGYSTTPPAIPEPAQERPQMSMEERLEELEERVAVLEERLAGHDQPASEQPSHEPKTVEVEVPSEEHPKRGRWGRKKEDAE